MRFFASLALLLLVTACGERNTHPDSQGKANSAVEEEADSGQGRALEAGRELIGKQAPAAQLRTIEGDAIDLSRLYGREPVYPQILGHLVHSVPRADARI